jgi:uncharacterized delta-60 repeat protein
MAGLLAVVGACCVLLLQPGGARAATPPGALDPGFGDGGLALVEEASSFDDAAVYPSGPHAMKVIASGVGLNDELLLARFNPDGSLDPSFGDDGVLVAAGLTPGPSSDVALDGTGRILVLIEGGIARFGPDGALDPSFGECGCGQYAADPSSWLTGLAVDTTGADRDEVLFSGTKFASDSDDRTVAMAGRLDTGGELRWERTFAISASPHLEQTDWAQMATGVAEDPTGQMVVGGWRRPIAGEPSQDRNEIGAVRLDPNGSFDTSFGTGGGTSHDIGQMVSWAESTGIAVDQSGRVLITGRRNVPADYCPEGPVLRLTATGALDPSFSGDGVALGVTDSDEVAVDGEGRILASGIVRCIDLVSIDAGVVRLTPDGEHDPTFGNDGYAHAGESDHPTNFGYGMALDNRGVIVAGQIDSTAGLARFLSEPQPDGGDGGTGSSAQGGVAGGVDTNARNVTVHKVVVPKKLGKLAKRGVRVLASCEQDCRIEVEVRVSRELADSMGLGSTLLGRGSVPAAAGERRWIRAKLTGAERRALLASGGGGRLKVNVTGLAP